MDADVARESALGSTPRQVARPSVVGCCVFLLGLSVALRTAGFNRTLHWLKCRTAHVALTRHHSADAVQSAEHAVALAAALYPGRALCLEQSLALYYYLRRAGVDARLRLGVQPHPFRAHAWIEYRDQPINDFAEHVKHFLPLPDISA